MGGFGWAKEWMEDMGRDKADGGRLLIYVEMGITMPFSGAEIIYVSLSFPAS